MSTEENQRKKREEKDWEKVANRASRSRRIWSYVTGETELSGCDVARKNDDCYYRSRNSTSRPVQARIRIETCDSSKKILYIKIGSSVRTDVTANLWTFTAKLANVWQRLINRRRNRRERASQMLSRLHSLFIRLLNLHMLFRPSQKTSSKGWLTKSEAD